MWQRLAEILRQCSPSHGSAGEPAHALRRLPPGDLFGLLALPFYDKLDPAQSRPDATTQRRARICTFKPRRDPNG
jgi:hypothetical protein